MLECPINYLFRVRNSLRAPWISIGLSWRGEAGSTSPGPPPTWTSTSTACQTTTHYLRYCTIISLVHGTLLHMALVKESMMESSDIADLSDWVHCYWTVLYTVQAQYDHRQCSPVQLCPWYKYVYVCTTLCPWYIYVYVL